MADNKLLNVWALVVATVLASSSWGFQTNVDSEVDGADLIISKDGSDGGDLTVEGQLSIGSVDTASTGVAASIDITSSSDDDKLPTVIAVRKLKTFHPSVRLKKMMQPILLMLQPIHLLQM